MNNGVVAMARFRSPRDQRDRISWLNSSGETVPPFACVKLLSYDDATNQFQIDKPDGGNGLYYTNGPSGVASNKYSGSGMWDLPRRCLLDATTYVLGDEVGPVAGQWGMGSGGTGWRVMRPPNADSHAVVQMIGGGGGSNMHHGIVRQDHGQGYYTVEIGVWRGDTPYCDEVNGPSCDPCEQAAESGSGSDGLFETCPDTELGAFINQVYPDNEAEEPVMVLAYDPASFFVPLEIDSDCLMVDLGDTNAVEVSGYSQSGGDIEPVFQIVRGFQHHEVAYDNQYDCCDGVYVLISKTAYIFAAKKCPPLLCDPECADIISRAP